MTNTNAKLQQAGQTATQGKLQTPPGSTAVNASLQNSKITADVAGKVIGQNNTELKAVQQTLPPDTASQNVKGQVLPNPPQPSDEQTSAARAQNEKSTDTPGEKSSVEKSAQEAKKSPPEKSSEQTAGDKPTTPTTGK
jgi:hypothetical protein